MTVRWRNTTLGELEREVDGTIQTGPFGSQLHMSDYSDSGTPVVMPTNIRDMRVDPSGIARVGSDHVRRLSRHQLRAGDIVYSRRGDVEKCALITEREAGWLCGTGCLLVRVQAESVDGRFLAYALSTSETRSWVSQHAVGATMPNLNTSILREVPVSLPPIDAQQRIAAALGLLDKKIESNLRAAGLLLELVAAEYRRVVSSAPIERVPFSRLASTTKGVSYKSVELQHSRTSLVTLKSFDRNGGYKPSGLKPYVGSFKPQQILNPGEMAVAQTDLTQGAEVVGRVIRVPADPSADVLVASLDLNIVRPNNEIEPEYLFGVLSDEEFRQHCRSHTSGTTVLHLGKDALPNYMVPLASQDEQRRYSATVVPLLARADQLNDEVVRLESMRDALLPELLSGRIQVPMETAA